MLTNPLILCIDYPILYLHTYWGLVPIFKRFLKVKALVGTLRNFYFAKVRSKL